MSDDRSLDARLVRRARGITGDGGLAEDVVQESMLAALNSLHRFEPTRAAFGIWLQRRCRLPRGDRRPPARPPGRGGAALRPRLLPPPEIADVLEIALGTVNSRLARAFDALRETMESPHVH